jgi:hypothetical protein
VSDFKAIGDALNEHLAQRYNTITVAPDSWAIQLGNLLLGALSVPVPWLRSIIDVLDDAMASRSVALPRPGGDGALIVYSKGIYQDPLHYACTVVHEHEHARVLKTTADLQVMVDYATPELRAASEARAYACGAFTEYLLTGVARSADDIVAPLNHGYLLTAPDVRLARNMLTSDLASMRAGSVPPHELCRVVLSFLQQNYPDAIVPQAFKRASA